MPKKTNREIKFRYWKDGMMIYTNWFNTDIDTWMQYTGLKDKNGKEIYEGDIIRMGYAHKPSTDIWEIKFGDYSVDGGDYYSNYTTAGFYAHCPYRDSDDDTSYINTERNGGIEVIGNIYYNPELLGDKQ